MNDLANIPRVKIDKLSYCAVPIQLMFSKTNKILATGTAFYYKHDNKTFLITNRHNLTGINPITKEFLLKEGGQPDMIQYVLLEHKKPYIQWKRYNKMLYKEEEMINPTRYIHPKGKYNIDVVAIEINNIDNLEIIHINDQDFDDIKVEVADNVFILGFPYNIKGGGNLPLWKRGTIATEPDLDIDNLPKILVDTASRSGMSGSPVIFRRDGIHNMGSDGSLKDDSFIGQAQGFVGIYSGRITGTAGVATELALEAQLGIVWKAKVIEEIIIGGVMDNRNNFTK